MSRASRNIVVILFIAVVQVNASKDPVSLLLNLVARHDNKPMVVYVNPGTVQANFIRVSIADAQKNDFDDLLLTNEGLINDDDVETNARDQSKYLLYKFLRTSPDQDSQLEDSKQILRQALRSRCQKVTKCVTRCTIEEPKCPMNCQKIFDELDLCDPPKKKPKKRGCGKTMPPKWRI